ncbi:hypothetical protein MFLAVUS_005938 [Mucor flavus]|uniref:Uncharacterized protein n=1 Tax=Mucor flavus TaxID=439312 RepID=A0ABP9Z051_9FUNG
MGNLSNTFTFKPILIRASKDSHCTRDILVSPFMTLFQLHKFILIVFDLNESSVEYHHFNLLNQLESVETFYEIIDHQEIDGFITPVAPGVYIEHTHPHEPLPLFSIYQSLHDDIIQMSFRKLRDERYCKLETIPSREITYEFQHNSQHYSIHLNLQPVNLPVQFLEEIDLNPKIIHTTGHFFEANTLSPIHHKLMHYYLPLSRNYKTSDENQVKHAFRTGIEKLLDERRRFLLKQKDCQWVEPTGEKCVYCALSM